LDDRSLQRLEESAAARREALLIARRALEVEVTGRGRIPQPQSPLKKHCCGAFVVLVSEGRTRACAGTLRPTCPNAAQEIAAAAAMGAAGDPWHPPLRSRDLKTAQVQVFLVGQVSPLRSIGELQAAREGLLARRGPRSGVILPGEARTASWALREARRKAGLRPSERADLFRFSAICWREPKPDAGNSRLRQK
jgi:AMMECR1 domain-containing protein